MIWQEQVECACMVAVSTYAQSFRSANADVDSHFRTGGHQMVFLPAKQDQPPIAQCYHRRTSAGRSNSLRHMQYGTFPVHDVHP